VELIPTTLFHLCCKIRTTADAPEYGCPKDGDYIEKTMDIWNQGLVAPKSGWPPPYKQWTYKYYSEFMIISLFRITIIL